MQEKSVKEVLSMDICDHEDSLYRIREGNQVRYLVIKPGVYDYEDVMCFPPALLSRIPPFPLGNWVTMNVYLDINDTPRWMLSYTPLPAVQSVWHSKLIDVLSLRPVRSLNYRTREVKYEGRIAIAKIARFDWEIAYVETETKHYKMIDNKDIGPRFLGHLVENGRVMGILLEKLEGHFAGIEDMASCESAVIRLHKAGLVHGDLNRYNFVVGKNQTYLIDLENAREYDEDAAQAELQSLPQALSDVSGVGAGFAYDLHLERDQYPSDSKQAIASTTSSTLSLGRADDESM